MPRTSMMEYRTESLDEKLDDDRQASYPGSKNDDWRESDLKSSLDGKAGETLDHRLDPLAEHDPHGHRAAGPLARTQHGQDRVSPPAPRAGKHPTRSRKNCSSPPASVWR